MRKIDQDPVVVAAKLGRLSPLRPTLGLVLGTGFGSVAPAVEVDAEVSYRELPGFPVPTVRGHAGRALIGRLRGTPVLVLSGRAHYYEGHEMPTVAFPIRALAAFGITDLLLTNAAGGINPRLVAGDLMVLSDHINLMGVNPLRRRPAEDIPPEFVDMTCVYDPGLRRLLARAGAKSGIRVRTGIYLAVSGPSYETPAEIKAFARLGADAVGMSTVPEAIVARQCRLRVAALSCITNLAAGRARQPLSHAEVLETAARGAERAARLVGEFAELYPRRRFETRNGARNEIRIEKPSGRGNVAGVGSRQ